MAKREEEMVREGGERQYLHIQHAFTTPYRRKGAAPFTAAFINLETPGGRRRLTTSVEKSAPSVCENDSDKSFTVSYLINSCGLSSKDAISVSKKVCFKSPENPDAVLHLLREYGFTDAHIPRIVTKRPNVLVACPNKTLLPKLEFFLSIGVPLPVLAHKLSVYPYVLMRSLQNSITPLYNELKGLLHSDERVVHVFSRAPGVFGRGWSKGISSNISILRERGVPESSIVSLIMYQPSLLTIGKDKLAVYVDRAVEMGFDLSKGGFVHAIQVFVDLSESTLKHKMEVYRKCGWSESDIVAVFLRYPLCMKLSEKKIMANMDFLVNELGCKPAAIAQRHVLLNFSLEKRIKPRCLVAKILNEKGLKNMTGVTSLLIMSEEKFLKRYIAKYQEDIPELLDIYRGKLIPPEIDLIQDVIAK
ncbi:hypothetical protein DH2020_001616 [Rehmannia glutinosa]|uniref:Uncharacterized protein n=1 Tax=Rehmannia glutinosa TaxID=99300 RepID=A0ABR0XZW2_REHGL